MLDRCAAVRSFSAVPRRPPARNLHRGPRPRPRDCVVHIWFCYYAAQNAECAFLCLRASLRVCTRVEYPCVPPAGRWRATRAWPSALHRIVQPTRPRGHLALHALPARGRATWRPRRQQVLAAAFLGWSKLVPLPPTSMYSNPVAWPRKSPESQQTRFC